MQLGRTLRSFVVLVALLTAASLVSCTGAQPETGSEGPRGDVVVYGGTPAAVATAIAAAREGADVTLLAEASTVGGMMSNGISASDIGSRLAVQGLAAAFFQRVRDHYDDPDTWRFEPHVAEEIHRAMLHEAGVEVVYDSPLVDAAVEDRTIRCITTGTGRESCADTFVDASYTGDLIAAAGVPYRLGSEDLMAYGEDLPSHRRWTQTAIAVPAEAEAARQAFEHLPFVRVEDELPAYEDVFQRGNPSLAYRLCVTDRPENRVAFQPAVNYQELLPALRVMGRAATDEVEIKSNGTVMSDLYHLAVLPAGKYDLNAGLRSFTNLPAPDDYFDSREQRDRYNEQLREYVGSFFHFVQTDASVPTPVREAFANFGLCADEFTENGNWPREPYVREARRIEGRYTFTQKDVFHSREKSTSVALGSYNIDGKLSQFVFVDGTLHRDMGRHASAPVYEIPYATMLPKTGSVLNVLAPIGLSASPTAYGSLRMEPQYMALGEAAGIAAALAGRSGQTVASVSPAAIQEALTGDGVVFKVRDICEETPGEFRRAGGYTATCGVVPVEPKIIL